MLTTILPPNSTALETAVDLAAAKSIESIPEKIIYDQWHPQFCPTNLLGFLAWAVSVDDWSPDWSEDVKRAVIAASLKVHRHKGTLSAARHVLKALGVSSDIHEYPETPVPHTVEAIAYVNRPLGDGAVLLDEITTSTVQRHLEFVKPARTTVTLKLGAAFRASLAVAAVARISSINPISSTVKTTTQTAHKSLRVGCFARVTPMFRLSAEAVSGASALNGTAQRLSLACSARILPIIRLSGEVS